MPIGYGQCKGRKYNNVQKIYDKKNKKKKPKVINAPKMKTCGRCGERLPVEDFATKHFCKNCMAEIDAKSIDLGLGGE